jgi:CheY-like chemotaxis protein
MVSEQFQPEKQRPPETFIVQVKDALEHLYDFPYLQHHALVQQGWFAAGQPGETAGQRFRHELIAAIESLNPGPGLPFHAPHARLYNLLLLHYVEGVTIQEVAHELGISRRQAHRDLRRGDESIASILWARLTPPAPPEPKALRLSSIEEEMARLETYPRPTDICLLLERAQQAVEPLALQCGLHFQVDVPPQPVVISVDPAVARQVLINTLSAAIGQAQPGNMRLVLLTNPQQTSVSLAYALQPQVADATVLDRVVAQLANRLGWSIRQEDQPGGQRVVTVDMTGRGSTVLIIEDNEGLVELLKDYLNGQNCQVVAATSGQEGLRLAEELIPSAVILDVMIPEMDGWELLQRLRHRPRTAQIPVIICSVLNNPELAYSLGASLFLPKPVSRNNILAALRQIGIV